MSACARLMLPVLLYPLMIPLLMAAMGLTTALLNGESLGGANSGDLRILVAFDATFTALCGVPDRLTCS